MTPPETCPSFPLITSDRLAPDLGDWAVLDASVVKVSATDEVKAYRADREAFIRAGHIPCARFADILQDFSDPLGSFPFTRPAADQFQAAARRLGLSRRDRIVVYDRSNGIWAARLWWLFRAFGHDHVAVLDGGFRRWRDLGLPLAHDDPAVAGGDFEAVEHAGFFVDLDWVKTIVAGGTQARLLNVLRRPVFEGREKSYARAGHIPGSVNVPYAELLDPTTNTLMSRDELADQFSPAIGDGKPIVTYCGGGITAAAAALALAVLGRTDVAVYDGSLNEWVADPALPLFVGP